MCKQTKEDLKRLKTLNQGEKRDTKEKGEVAISYKEDDGALIVDGGETREGEWIMDSNCSFHSCCKREKFSKFEACDDGLVTSANDEKVKIEGIGEVVVEIHDGVKRKLGDARYIPKFGKNLISLGGLEEKRCTLNACDGVLKVKREHDVHEGYKK